MEYRRAQFRLAIQVVGLRRIYLPNGLIILFTSLSLRQMILSCCHYSHTKNIDVVDKAREHSVSIVSLPSHSTHKMQPLDVVFLKPLKTYYAQEIEKWLCNNPGRNVTPFLVCKLFGPAYIRAATMETSVNSFTKTGLFPGNRHILQDHEFACHGMDESQDGAGNEISRPGTSKVSFHNASGGKFIIPADVRPMPSSNTQMFCSNRSSKTIKSELCKAINSFSLQQAVAGLSGEKRP